MIFFLSLASMVTYFPIDEVPGLVPLSVVKLFSREELLQLIEKLDLSISFVHIIVIFSALFGGGPWIPLTQQYLSSFAGVPISDP
jgi:hypothetical protein